jgi:hypothetical protein
MSHCVIGSLNEGIKSIIPRDREVDPKAIVNEISTFVKNYPELGNPLSQ